MVKKKEKVHPVEQKIIAAAQKVFLQNGFKQTTVTLIAKEAGIGYGTVYLYFPSGKDEVLLHIMGDVMSEFYKIAELEYTPTNKFEAYEFTLNNTRNFLKLAIEHQDLLAVIHEAIGYSSLIRFKWEDIIERFIIRVSKNIEIVKEKGLIHNTKYNPRVVAGSLIYPGEKFLWKLALNNTNKSYEEIAKDIAGIYTFGLFK